MNIKWAYGLIAIIYSILIILRIINYKNLQAYRKKHTELLKVFIVKKDFFTSVTVVCILVTLAINCAACIGGQPLNISSIIVTCLIIGFTIINSFGTIYFEPSKKTIFLLGYELNDTDIKSVKCKKRKNSYVLNVIFERDIEGYNYAKFIIYGEDSESLVHVFEQFAANGEQDENSKNK